MHTIGKIMTVRKISPASLENLKLGAIARRKDKVRVNVTLLPTTIKWLQEHHAKGEISGCIDEVVRRIMAGELVKKSD